MFHKLSSIINFRTFRSEAGEWKRFGGILLLLIGGTLVVLALALEFITLRIGQMMPYEEAAREQANNPALLWNDGDAYQPDYKLVRMAQVRPDIVVMGQSRMIQFRSAMFHPYSFYNLSKTAWTYGVDSELWERLPADYKPKAVIFCFDFFNLHPTYLASYADTLPRQSPSFWSKQLLAWRDIYNVLYMNPQLLLTGRRDAEGQPAIGLHAACFDDGVRQDGSESLPLAQLNTAGRNRDLAKTIRLNGPPVFYGDTISDREMVRLEKFIDLVHTKGTTAIAVQMPIYGPVMRAIESDPQFGILNDFHRLVSSGYLEKRGVIFLDYSHFPPYSDDYHYFIDAFHPTEAAYAAVVLKMASDPRVKAALPKLDTTALQRKIEENRGADQNVYLYHNDL